jgi:hypothetical protein
LRTVDIGFDRADGAFDDELNANGGSKVDNHIGVVDKLGKQLAILDMVEVILQQREILEMADVVHAASGKVVEEDDAIAAIDKAFSQMGTDKTGTAGNQIAQRASLQGLAVIVVVGPAV